MPVFRSALLLATLGCASDAMALSPMTDQQLSSVAGQDGIAINVGLNEITASSVNWTVESESGTPRTMQNEGFSISGVQADGSSPGAVNNMDVFFDAGGDGVDPLLGVNASWDRTRVRIDDIRHSLTPANSLGTVVLDQQGSFTFSNVGILNSSSSKASMALNFNDTSLFYRQADNDELVFDNLSFTFGADNATFAATDTGLTLDAPVAPFSLNFELAYREDPAQEFITSADIRPMLLYGWQGDFVDMSLTLAGGSVSGTEGLNINFSTDFSSDFEWIAGEADDGAGGAIIHFQDYRVFDDGDPGVVPPYHFGLPNIIVDLLNTGEGVPGVCYGVLGAPLADCEVLGGEVLELGIDDANFISEADAPALATIIRGGGLHAFPERVLLEEGGCDPLTPGDCDSFNWGLITTFANINSDILIYPGGNGVSRGLRADVFWSSQSGPESEWETNTHLMIADTLPGQDVGIGFVNADLALEANDLYLTIGSPAGPTPFTDQVASVQRNGLRIQSSDLRFNLDATLGGGDIAALGPVELIRLAEWEFDLRGELDFVLYPPPNTSEAYLGYSADMNIQSPSGFPSFLSLAEPSRPEVELRMSEISGRLYFGNGKIDVTRTVENPIDNVPKLTFQHDILVDDTTHLTVNNVEFGGDYLGKIVVPGGSQWHARFALKPQSIQ